MRRGELATVALQGDLGKPRPVLIVQSDLFEGHPTVTVLPLTSDLREAPMLRLLLAPDERNGLQRPSRLMVDRPQSVKRDKVGPPFGRVDDATMLAVNRALAVFLGIA